MLQELLYRSHYQVVRVQHCPRGPVARGDPLRVSHSHSSPSRHVRQRRRRPTTDNPPPTTTNTTRKGLSQTSTTHSAGYRQHVVALAEAWRSGASEWSAERREEFANDLTNPQLIAVTASSNRSKGDQDPADWMPPNPAAHCTYAQIWVGVKIELDIDGSAGREGQAGHYSAGLLTSCNHLRE
ncbi:HNH endonuclease family protein [Nocardia carnea]|uniref:HNH endonuclease family protein n=1 Tax=Nocardia carnea TaxID=37328 RepID=UPI003D7755CA